MNKKLKIIGIIAIVLLICWGSMFMIDRSRTLNLKEPTFARLKYTQQSYPSESTYKGIGYTIIVEKGSDIISVTMTMFGKVVAGAIT